MHARAHPPTERRRTDAWDDDRAVCPECKSEEGEKWLIEALITLVIFSYIYFVIIVLIRITFLRKGKSWIELMEGDKHQ